MNSPLSPGSYPGNPSLPVEVREKILATFRHALNLFTSGNVSDCVIGCEFILKMDPRFTPAQRLREKARNRDSDVDVSELQALVSPQAPGSPAAPRSSAPAPAPAPAAEPRPGKPDPQRLLAEAEQKCEARDFDGALAAATRALTLAPGNKDALAMIEKAAGKKAMQPLIEASRANAEEALAQGRLSDARREVERLRAADPKHPSLPSLERRLSAPSAPAAAAPPDSGPGPQDSGEFSLGGPQSEGHGDTPAFGDLSAEPFGLDPVPPPSSALSSGAPEDSAQDEARSGLSAYDETSPDAEALVPPSLSPRDLFLPMEDAPGTAMPSSPGAVIDEEEARAAEREIGALIRQGDEAAKKGDREQAIEIWSRVFLIDINNSEAVTRIEKARQEAADESRLVAECLKKGRESFEAGDREAARRFFLQAQSLAPGEPTAGLYLERIEKADAEKAAPAAVGEAAAKPAMSARVDDFPAAAAAPPPPERRRAAVAINPRVLAVVAAFLALTLAGIYFVFRGTRTQAPPQKTVSSGSVQRAREFLEKGQIAEARTELRRIGPTDPDSEEARKLLANLDRGGAPEAGRAVRPASPAGAASSASRGDTDPASLRAVAEKALEEKRYIEALKNFNLAAPAFRDDPSFAKEQSLASDKVTALTPAVKLYNEDEYETAIPILWRIVQEDRDNQDARSYLLRSYYNQGITQLQNGLYQKAMQAFHEALAIDPNDSEAARHMKFAERYQKGDLDLMGRIYVRHVNHRQ
jgi:tetratricopeptide (TPR) repeat protein